ncbi:MFS transporter [Achromobacter sp. 413638]|uniref:MFS transporter n=1 Tax=Achromobacter sp. 413638 TaxID=3342385 RepID=UPI00324ED3A2
MNRHSRVRRAPVYGAIIAGGITLFGNAVAAVALPWLVLGITGSAAWTGAAAAAGMVPLIIGAFFGGQMLERHGARRVAVAADLVSAGSLIAIALLHENGQLGMTALMALIALGALFDGPGMAASESRYPELARLARMPLERVTAMDELADGAATIAGPIAAGLSIALVGPELTLWLTALCSITAAALNAIYLPGRRRAARGKVARQGALIGVRFLWSEPPLRALVLTGMAVVSLFSALDAVVMPVFLRDSGRDAADLGSFLALAGGGAIVSALAYARHGQRLGPRRILLASLALETLAFALLALQDGDALMLLSGALAGLGVGPLNPLISTALLRGTPAAIRGRVLSAFNALALVATPLAVLLAGAAIELAGTRAVMICLAAMFALLALPYLLAPAHEAVRAARPASPTNRESSR